MTSGSLQDARRVAGMLNAGLFVLTSAYEGRRSGVVATSLAWAADDPMLVAVFVRRGHWIEPIIRDSRRFAACRVEQPESTATQLMLKRFSEASRPRDGDPFDGLEASTLVTGSPVIARSTLVFDCEVHRHFDLDADHEAYIGLVRAIRLNGVPMIIEAKPGHERTGIKPRGPRLRPAPPRAARSGPTQPPHSPRPPEGV